MTDPRYPIGKFNVDREVDDEKRRLWLAQIAEAPVDLRKAVAGLSAERLDTTYRPGGWTIRQVLHHLPDSHLNGYVRFKLALTEEQPTIKPYLEAMWAETADNQATPVEVSLVLLESLHERWVNLLRSLSSADLARTFLHPQSGPMTLDAAVSLYAWHGRHHIAHITCLRQARGWI